MTEADALAELSRVLDVDTDPALSPADVDGVLRGAARPDSQGNLVWRPQVAVAAGEVFVPSARNGHYYTAVTGGVTAATAPVWPVASSGTVADGTVVWQESGVAVGVPVWDMNAAIAAGCEMKALRCGSLFTFSADGATFNRSEMAANWWRAAEHYRDKAAGSVPIEGLRV